MEKSYDVTLPINFDGSLNPDLLMDVTLGPYLEYSDGTVPMVTKMNTGRMSPVRSRTMKEYDSQITDLKKENFNLKLRIYFMEERMQQRHGNEDVFKTNIELNVEVESLKKDLADKQELLKKASDAIEALSTKNETYVQEMREELEKEMNAVKIKLEEDLECKKKEFEASQKSLQEASHQLTDLENRNEQLQMEIRHLEQSKEIQLQSLKEELEAKKAEVACFMTDNKENLSKVEQLQKDNGDLNFQIESLQKELSRRDRDLEDVLEDQKTQLQALQKKAKELENDVEMKNGMIGQLEDLLKKIEEEKKDITQKFKETDAKLKNHLELQPVWDGTVKGLHQDLKKRNKEVDDLKDQLNDKNDELKQCRDELHDMTVKKQKEIDKQHEDITFLEDSVSSMKLQLKERELQVENLLRNLGKKEGELEGFKELLNKAETALRQSEDAVQDLQSQLKKEKESACEDFKFQQLQYKLDELQSQLSAKEKIIEQLNENLEAKDRQMQHCMEIFKPGENDTLNEKYKLIDEKEEEIQKLKRDIHEKERDMERANQMLITAEETIESLERDEKDKDKTMKQLTNALKASQKSLEDAMESNKRELKEKEEQIEKLQALLSEKDKLLQEHLKRKPNSNGKEKFGLDADVLEDLTDEKNSDMAKALLQKLRSKDRAMLEQQERHDNELSKLDREIYKLRSELSQAQQQLQDTESKVGWSGPQNDEMMEKLREAIREKDKVIKALVESGQEKEQLIVKLQTRPSDQDVEQLTNQLYKLRNELLDKNELIDSLKSEEKETDSDSNMRDLKIELKVTKENLKSAYEKESHLKQELQNYKLQLAKMSDRDVELHKLEREVTNLRDQLPNPQQNTCNNGLDMNSQQFQETMDKQLQELRKLNASLQNERQIVLNLSETRHSSHNSDGGTHESELHAIQNLHQQLADVLERNNNMSRVLEQQLQINQGLSRGYPTDVIQELAMDLDTLKKELEQKKQENNSLIAQLYDLKHGQKQHGYNDYIHAGAQTSPTGESRRWSSSSGSSSPDFDIPVNRQTLSDMNAPMLRRYIRHLQKQLDRIRGENDDLQEQLDLSCKVETREIPGKNEDDFNSIPHLRLEIESLQSRLSATIRELTMLRGKIGLDVNSPSKYENIPNLKDLQKENCQLKIEYRKAMEKISQLQHHIDVNMKIHKETVSKLTQTVAWSGLFPVLGNKQTVSHTQKQSQIPRLQHGQPMNGNLPHTKLEGDSNRRILDLEAKLKATENTVHLQTQKMKYYKSLLQDHGLVFKSPCVSRSHSETNLAALATTSRIPVRQRAMSNDNLASLSQQEGKRSNQFTRQRSNSSDLSCDGKNQNLSSCQKSALPSKTLEDLRNQIVTLQNSLQETKNNNSELQQRLSSKQNSEQIISDLQGQLLHSRSTVEALEKQLKNYQGTSIQQVLELQRDEIGILKKKLCNSQNSCVHLDQWLGELSEFLEGLGENEGWNHSVKQKVDKSHMVVKSLSSVLESEDGQVSDRVPLPEGLLSRNSDHSPQRFVRELDKKNAEIKSLKEELEEKKSFINKLNNNLLLAQKQLLSWQDCGKGSSTSGASAADGNVYETGRNINRDVFQRDSLSPGSHSSVSNKIANDNNASIEKLRHRSDSGNTHSSRRSSGDIEVQDNTLASSHTSSVLHQRNGGNSKNGDILDKYNHGDLDHLHRSFNAFNTDERLFGNARFADRDMFEQTLTPTINGDRDVSFVDGRQLLDNSYEKFSEIDDTKVTQRSSFLEKSCLQSQELSQLKSQLSAMRDLNKTLKDELHAYENLCSSAGIPSSPPRSPNKTNSDNDLLREHLSEIRALRIKLENSLKDSEKLSQRLQEDMTADHDASSTTANVYLYSQHQAHINELQKVVDKLKMQLRERENSITEKITIIREKDRIIHESKTIITEHNEKVKQMEREKDEQSKVSQQTLVVQQRRIDKQDETITQLQQKLDLQVESLHQQESKLKEQYEIIQKQDYKLQELHDVLSQKEASLSQKESSLDKQYELLQQQDLQIDKQKDLIDQKDRNYKSLEKELEGVMEKLRESQNCSGSPASRGQSLEREKQMLRETIEKQDIKIKQQEEWLTDKDKTNYKLQQIRDRLDENLKKSGKEIKRLKEEMRSLKDQVQENKDLNKTLKLELSVYERLENTENQGNIMGDGKFSEFNMKELLTEIRHLRVQLERCIETNNNLRGKLEEHLRLKNQKKKMTSTKNTYPKDPSPVTSQGTDAPDGLPSAEQPTKTRKVLKDSIEHIRSSYELEATVKSLSNDSCISDTASGISSSSGFNRGGFGLVTWPLTSDSHVQPNSKSAPWDTFQTSQMSLRLHQSDGNLSYHVNDPPSMLADYTNQKVDSDMRCLFAIGKLDDFEKLKKENGECAVVLKGMEARIQERLKIFKSMSPRESVEYSTLKELSMSVENLRICLNEEKSLIGCFWTSALPKESMDVKLVSENESLQNELCSLKTKYSYLTQCLHSAEDRLHATNQQKQNMDDFIYKQYDKLLTSLLSTGPFSVAMVGGGTAWFVSRLQLFIDLDVKKTAKVMIKARGNFEKKIEGMQQIHTTDTESSSRLKHRKDSDVSLDSMQS